MNIRSKIFHGISDSGEPIFHAKRPRGAKADDILSVAMPRSARRTADHRVGDRHRLQQEHARLTHDGVDYDVELINLSGGGAMVSGAPKPKLWDRVALHLGPNGTVECAVCWRRGGRIGLQFVEETRLDCSVDEVAALLREVIANSFPEARFELSEPSPAAPEPVTVDDEGRAAPRHPLIWNGILHHDYQSNDVRVRNISRTGAMIESATPVRVGTEPLLELSEAVSISTTVEWAVGDQVGLRFHSEFDMTMLAQIRPALATGNWTPPSYLEQTLHTARNQRWNRVNLDDLRAELEGFMKR